MSMVINTNDQGNRILGVYNRNNTQMNAAMTRVATAQKINSAKDGAANWAISERMRERIRANDQANQNVQNDTALLKTAQGGIENTIDILKTLKERAINASNDSNLNQNRSDIATEVQQLVQQIDDNANKVKFNGRTLLNGAYDTTVGSLNSASAIDNSAKVSDNPTETSTHAVYRLNNLYKYGTDGAEAAASNTNLISLVKGNATSAGDTIFQVGDKINFSWKENGTTVTSTLTVDSNTKVSDLAAAMSKSNLGTSWVASNTALTATALSSGTNLYASSSKVVNTTDFTELKSTSAGVYAVGKQNVAITDFSVSVTYEGANGRATRTEAQEAISPTALQQSFGTSTGSNAVYSSAQYNTATNAGISGTNSTAFKDWTVAGTDTKVWTNTSLSNLQFTINTSMSNGDQTINIAASSNLDDLNKILNNYGIQATLVGQGEAVTYNGTAVTRDAGGNDAVLKAPTAGLYFVAADGVDISKVTVKGQYDNNGTLADTNFSNNSFASTGASEGTLYSAQTRAEDNIDTGASAALTFFVGGEPNFGMDVTIGKMTVNSLLGTNANAFANKFLTKEGAQSAMTMIDNALNTALNEQTKLGAIEARLGYTGENLSTMNENLQSADSAIRDSDLAKEMTTYMKYSVLAQASQYMLAQSSQNAFSVLNLLQS